jgi:hypothetical protein
MAFSPDGRSLAATCDYLGPGTPGPVGVVKVWDVAGRERWSQSRVLMDMETVAFSPDGRALATGGSEDNFTELRLWDTATGEVRATERRLVRRLAFSPDGRTLAAALDQGETILREAATWTERLRLPARRVTALAFSPDGRLLATGGEDRHVAVWDMTGRLRDGRLRPGELTAERAEALWADLGSEDAARAFAALWELAASPRAAVKYLEGRLPLAPQGDAKHLARLIGDLDADEYEVREKATADLEAFGRAAESELRACLAGRPSAEVRRRAEELLQKLQEQLEADDGRPLRQALRLVEVLEQIGDPGASDALGRLAVRGRWLRVREEAKAALARLAQRASGGR